MREISKREGFGPSLTKSAREKIEKAGGAVTVIVG